MSGWVSEGVTGWVEGKFDFMAAYLKYILNSVKQGVLMGKQGVGVCWVVTGREDLLVARLACPCCKALQHVATCCNMPGGCCNPAATSSTSVFNHLRAAILLFIHKCIIFVSVS